MMLVKCLVRAAVRLDANLGPMTILMAWCVYLHAV